ncbi:outer membrane lipoprotein chaperone LolA [Moraxella oculi]|uniref:Outer-membrane lipoprotein carrier protein n=1 Tax=Moraxella oculi TaxID=2940516 RepID=A0ABW8U5S6_9GAMM
MSKSNIINALTLKACLTAVLGMGVGAVALPAVAIAEPASQQMAVSNLNKLLSATNSMTAHFTQTTNAGKKTTNYSGTMAVQRQNQFRWETRSPAHQLIVANGSTMWVYDPDLNQVLKQSTANQVGDSPAILLSGDPQKIASSFHVNQPNINKNYFKLTPKSGNAGFNELYISFNGGKPVQIIVMDMAGQQTTIRFSKISVNKRIDGGQFNFTVPKGVEIINQ